MISSSNQSIIVFFDQIILVFLDEFLATIDWCLFS